MCIPFRFSERADLVGLVGLGRVFNSAFLTSSQVIPSYSGHTLSSKGLTLYVTLKKKKSNTYMTE